MPFDPTKPATNAPNSSAEMRSQLNGLKDLIDAILTVTDAQVDSTNTLPPGSAANASVSVVGNTLHFSFDLPQGSDGMPGSNGSDGAQGPPGNDGSLILPLSQFFTVLNHFHPKKTITNWHGSSRV